MWVSLNHKDAERNTSSKIYVTRETESRLYITPWAYFRPWIPYFMGRLAPSMSEGTLQNEHYSSTCHSFLRDLRPVNMHLLRKVTVKNQLWVRPFTILPYSFQKCINLQNAEVLKSTLIKSHFTRCLYFQGIYTF